MIFNPDPERAYLLGAPSYDYLIYLLKLVFQGPSSLGLSYSLDYTADGEATLKPPMELSRRHASHKELESGSLSSGAPAQHV